VSLAAICGHLRYDPLDDWLSQAALARPDHVALVEDDRSLTYAELDRAASDRAAGLTSPVLLRERGIDFAVRLHACTRAGAVAVPVDPRLAEPATEPPVGTHTLLFTSGTTGEPKPVALTRQNHEASARALGQRLALGPGDRWLCPLSLFHVGGLAILLRAVIHGSTVVLQDGFEARRVREALEHDGITHVSLVPTMLMRLSGLKPAPSLRAVLLGGGPIPADLLESGLPLVPTYGMTETGSAVATGSPGEPLAGVELRIGDGDEILVRGPMVSTAALGADGWLHTGDRGSLDGGGRLRVEGRLKDLIVTGGENVSASKVESILRRHPAVADVAVLGVPDREWGEAVTAFVVLREPLEASVLIDHCREGLAPFEVPKRVHPLDELPRNAAGKVERHRLA
jgi:o-succinylbenzoate---CoA ligase